MQLQECKLLWRLLNAKDENLSRNDWGQIKGLRKYDRRPPTLLPVK